MTKANSGGEREGAKRLTIGSAMSIIIKNSVPRVIKFSLDSISKINKRISQIKSSRFLLAKPPYSDTESL